MTAARATDAGPRAALDPDVRRFVEEMSAAWASHPGLATATPAETRRIAEMVRAPWTAGGPTMARVADLELTTAGGDVRVRLFAPESKPALPALVYLHGGGWTIFSLRTHDRLMRELAARAGVAVVGVDYALAPEAKFPVALEQVVAAVRHLAVRGGELGLDPARLAIGGDSAGANLAVAAALRLRDLGAGAALRGLLLNYGVFRRSPSPGAARELGGPGHMLTADEMDAFWRNYLRDEGDAANPLAVPALADLAGLPPAFLVGALRDLLFEQSVELHEKLLAAGVLSRLEVYPGASHSFLEAVSIAPLAGRALDDAAAWLRAALAA